MAKPVKHRHWLVWLRMVRETFPCSIVKCGWCEAWKRGMRWRRICVGPCNHAQYRRSKPKAGL